MSDEWGSELVVRGLACHRGERVVFVGLDCAMPAGGAVVLTGANGSGKSSLLRLLATLLSPASGEISWAGRPVGADLPAYRARLHYVGHLDGTKAALTVRETLSFWSEMRQAPVQVDEALALFGLETIADFPCRWLSAGQRRRLALARLVAAPAPLWLLDEPTAALDAEGEASLLAAIAAHRAVGGSVVAATHQPLPLAGAVMLSIGDYAPAAATPVSVDF